MANVNLPPFEEDIDEEEEEALLKSDDEIDGAAKIRTATDRALKMRDELIDTKSLELNDSMDNLMEHNDAVDNDGVADADDDDDDDDDDDADDDDADDDDEEEDKVLAEFKAIVKDLERQQYAYDKYLRLCELSHTTGDLDYIRKAYGMFAKVYPLAPELWLKYLGIEASVSFSEKEMENVEYLFRRALRDYYSVEVAMQFAALAARMSQPEEIWQELLGTYGLHCMKGHEFFRQYRQYIASHATYSAEDKQNAYIKSYLMELKYPLHNMEESYIEFKVFYEKNKAQITCDVNWEFLDRNYFKSKEHLQKIMQFEDKLDALEMNQYRERSEVYLQYIRESDKFLDENVLQTVYERMVADCCLSADSWLLYIDFLDYRDEFGRPTELQELPVFQQKAVDVNNRALRNCTWSEKLYIKRIQLLEKLEKSREEIQEVLENSLSAGFQTAEPAVAIWLEYLSYLRRHTDWENEGECDILRKNFNLCWTILGQQWGVLADCNCEILQFWGRLEYGPLQDAKRGKELWTTVMESSDNATKSGLWIEFILMEMRRDLESARKLFRKALHTQGLDNPPVIVSAWTRFERCNGTMSSLIACSKECEEFMLDFNKNVHSFQSGNKAREAKGTKRKSNSAQQDSSYEKRAKPSEKPTKSPNKQTQPLAASTEPKPQDKDAVFKEHENQEIDLAKDHLRIFLSNLDYNLTETDIREGLSELNIVSIDLIRSANGRSRGFGYLELISAAEVEKALGLDRRALNGRPIFISSVLRDKEKRQKFKYSDGLEPKKLFVKSLAPDTTKEELEKVFSPFGKLKDVRLVHHKSGKFKNIAYVEYENQRAAGKAVLATDQMELRGHIISVAISAPPPKPSQASGPTINPTKLLGMNKRRAKVFDQKPRMSLIPNVVRKNLVSAAPSTAAANGASTATTTTKTNEDFRKLLQNP